MLLLPVFVSVFLEHPPSVLLMSLKNSLLLDFYNVTSASVVSSPYNYDYMYILQISLL